MNTGRSAELLRAALSYAARGWKVFPLHTTVIKGACTCYLGFTCPKIAKHPRIRSNWRFTATSDAIVVREWWEKWPGSNIAIVTGSISGLVVIDIDDKNGKHGSSTLAVLGEQHDWTPNTLSATTGSGRHLYFRAPSVTIRTKVQGLGEGVDVKADGGYVVAPPSIHASLNLYRWDDPNGELADAPQWINSALCSNDVSAHCAVPTLTEPLPTQQGDEIPQGYRNVTLFKKACGLRGRGFGQDAIEALLQQINARDCNPPLSNDEVAVIARRASKYAIGNFISRKEKTNVGW